MTAEWRIALGAYLNVKRGVAGGECDWPRLNHQLRYWGLLRHLEYRHLYSRWRAVCTPIGAANIDFESGCKSWKPIRRMSVIKIDIKVTKSSHRIFVIEEGRKNIINSISQVTQFLQDPPQMAF